MFAGCSTRRRLSKIVQAVDIHPIMWLFWSLQDFGVLHQYREIEFLKFRVIILLVHRRRCVFRTRRISRYDFLCRYTAWKAGQISPVVLCPALKKLSFSFFFFFFFFRIEASFRWRDPDICLQSWWYLRNLPIFERDVHMQLLAFSSIAPLYPLYAACFWLFVSWRCRRVIILPPTFAKLGPMVD